MSNQASNELFLRALAPAENFNHDTRGANLYRRWRVYEFAEPAIDFRSELIESARLKGGETVLDIGCGYGQLLMDLRRKHGHQGRLIGLDPAIEQLMNMAIWLDQEVSETLAQDMEIEPLQGVAQNIPLDDSSIDWAVSEHQFYMIPPHEQDQTILEIKRVLKPDGVFSLATSGDGHKEQHRGDEKVIADFTGTKPPGLMNRDYNSHRAAEHLPQFFKHMQRIEQHTDMVFYPGKIGKGYEAIDIYFDSLLSMNDQFNPIPRPSQMLEAIDSLIRPRVLKEIEAKGFFRDRIRRDIFVCSDREVEPFVPGRLNARQSPALASLAISSR